MRGYLCLPFDVASSGDVGVVWVSQSRLSVGLCVWGLPSSHAVAVHDLLVTLRERLLAPVLLLADGVGQGREAEAWMEDGLSAHGDRNHDTLEGNELGLVAHHVAAPALDELGNTVDATDQDAEVSDNDSAAEELE